MQCSQKIFAKKPSVVLDHSSDRASASSFDASHFNWLTALLLRLILSKPLQLVLIALQLSALCLALFYGLSSAQMGASWKKLITDDSYLYDYVDSFDRDFWSQAVSASLPSFGQYFLLAVGSHCHLVGAKSCRETGRRSLPRILTFITEHEARNAYCQQTTAGSIPQTSEGM